MIEQELCCNFTNANSAKYKDRLYIYKYQTLFFKQNEFRRNTNDIGDNEQFKRYLNNYIKSMDSIKFNDTEIRLDKDGRFYLKDGRYKDLSSNEKMLFNYKCFCKLYEFWEGFEEICNLHHEPRKIVVSKKAKEVLNI